MWKKREHNSLNGVVIATSVTKGRVIDCEVLSKFCICEYRLKNIHTNDYIANYSGTRGGMEVEVVVNIFFFYYFFLI